MISGFRLVLLLLSVGSTTAIATPSEDGLDARQRAQLGLFGDLTVDDGELSLYVAGTADVVVWGDLLVHYGLSYEEKLQSFIRMRNVLGLGYLFTSGRSSFPLWFGVGITTTGLWSEYLNREFVAGGIGYRYHVGSRIGLGANVELALHDEGVTEQRVTLGVVYTLRQGN